MFKTKPIPVTPDTVQRLMDKCTPVDGGCWIWQGRRSELGYGRLDCNGTTYWAHRVSYTVSFGPIPEGLVIDHLCRNPSCVNPEHLEAVTQRENLMRGASPMAQARRTERCKRGHPRTPETVSKSGRCKRCKLDRYMELRRQREAEDPALREARLERQRQYGRQRYASAKSA